MKKIIKYLSSIKLTITLIILLIFFSILGTLIPQNLEKWKYIEIFGHHGYGLIKLLNLNKIYSSFSYLGILFLLAINISCCLLQKILKKEEKFIKELQNIKLHRIHTFKEDGKLKEKILDIIKDLGYSYRIKREEGVDYIYGEKRFWYKLGHYLTHISLLIIILGGLISSFWGFRDNLKIDIGEIIDIPGEEFKIKASDFQIKYYEDSLKVKSYESKIAVLEKGKEVFTKIIKVNHPLKYKGFSLYQSGYGTSKLKIMVNKEGKKKIYLVKVGERIPLIERNLSLKVEDFYPDLVVERGNIYSRSNHLHNPAAKISIYKEDLLVKRFWLFYKHIDYHKDLSWRRKDIRFKLVGFIPYTELLLVRDKGKNVVYGGFFIFIIGIILSLYFNYLKLYLKIERLKEEVKVEIAIKPIRYDLSVEKELKLIKKRIENL